MHYKLFNVTSLTVVTDHLRNVLFLPYLFLKAIVSTLGVWNIKDINITQLVLITKNKRNRGKVTCSMKHALFNIAFSNVTLLRY